ncbi:30S ribosomal protein S6e [Candidatus Woesearchaeota archaeon B3_Woes]|nr:MAG: 30S ribosomal protein S6e [Candidatus Woesearchaeota archaeon B3_Woes]
MADFKLTIADPKTGKCVQRELKSPEANILIGKKIGDKIEGKSIGLEDYEFELTGGSDYCGFPMRRDVQGANRKRILAVEGVGIKKKAKGIKQRKTVCGNTIQDKIVQINFKILKQGKENLFQAKGEEPKKEEKPKEETKAEKKETKPAEEKPKEEKKAEVKEDKPKEEPKEKPEEKK